MPASCSEMKTLYIHVVIIIPFFWWYFKVTIFYVTTCTKLGAPVESDTIFFINGRECKAESVVAQLIEHQVVMREVVSSTPAGPTLRVWK